MKIGKKLNFTAYHNSKTNTEIIYPEKQNHLVCKATSILVVVHECHEKDLTEIILNKNMRRWSRFYQGPSFRV